MDKATVMQSEPHKIVVRCWFGTSARFADVAWNEETSRVLNQCYKRDGVYYVNSASFRDVCGRHEIR